MIIRDTHNERRSRREIAQYAGKKFGLIERLKMGGIGSQRMVITDASDMILNLLSQDHAPDTCNIELRSAGIVVRFRSKMHTYAWAVPFHELSMFRNGEELSIYGKGEHMKMTTAHNEKLDRRFILKVLQYKANASPLHYEAN